METGGISLRRRSNLRIGSLKAWKKVPYFMFSRVLDGLCLTADVDAKPSARDFQGEIARLLRPHRCAGSQRI